MVDVVNIHITHFEPQAQRQRIVVHYGGPHDLSRLLDMLDESGVQYTSRVGHEPGELVLAFSETRDLYMTVGILESIFYLT